MVEGWTGTIDVVVTEGYVGYVATGDGPDAHGFAEISGSASFLGLSDADPSKFQISLAIRASRHRKPSAKRIRAKGRGRM